MEGQPNFTKPTFHISKNIMTIQRKTIFYICVAVSLAMMVANGILLPKVDRSTMLEGTLYEHPMVALIVQLAIGATYMGIVLWPNGKWSRNYGLSISHWRLRVVRQEMPPDPEGLRYIGWGASMVLVNLFFLLLTLAKVFQATLARLPLMVGGVVSVVVAVLLGAATEVTLGRRERE